MGRIGEAKSRGLGQLRKAASAVKRVLTRGRKSEKTAEHERSAAAEPRRTRIAVPPTSRPVRRESDIPLDVLDRVYTPPLTSSKASFRSDGMDHHQDQDFLRGFSAADWNDEDHYTNKSGDPRIGTHRRKHEAGEPREEQR